MLFGWIERSRIYCRIAWIPSESSIVIIFKSSSFRSTSSSCVAASVLPMYKSETVIRYALTNI